MKKESIELLEIDMKSIFNRLFYQINWQEEILPEHQTWLTGGGAGGGYELIMKNIKSFL
ncbi:TPA: hypothetical protein QCX47_004654 [Bacillus mycoides]|nr:hypothetical protein [Bacillus mycoides]